MSKGCFSNIYHHFKEGLIAEVLSLFFMLYFAYFIFFLPYLVQLLFFLSPLLVSTSLLLLLSLLTIFPHLEKPTRYGFLVNACQKIVDSLRIRLDDNVELCLFEPLVSMASELEACLELETLSGVEGPAIVEGALGESLEFATLINQRLTSKVGEELVEISQENDGLGEYKRRDVWEHSALKSLRMVPQKLTYREIPDKVSQQNYDMGAYESQELKTSILENLWCERETSSVVSQGLIDNIGEKLVEVPQQSEELGTSEHQEFKTQTSLGSLSCKGETRNVVSLGLTYNVGENSIKIPQQNDELGIYEHQDFNTLHLGSFGESETRSIVSQGLTCKVGENHVQAIDRNDVMSLNSGGYESMRKEKEWKRTLACKLYEERQSVYGTEDMDLLWEVYEVDSGKGKVKNKKEKKVKKEEIDHYDEEEEEEEDMDPQLCCLQALKFSTGKMNLGIRRLNSMRISKAFKGIGMFVRKERKIF